MYNFKKIKPSKIFNCDNNLYVIVNNTNASQSSNLGNNQNIFKITILTN